MLPVAFGVGIGISILVYIIGLFEGFNLRLLTIALLHATQPLSILTMVLLIPLYLAVRRLSKTRKLDDFTHAESKWRGIGLPILLYVLLRFFAITSLSIVYLVVLTLVLVENYALSPFGFTFRKIARNLALGVFIYTVGSLFPLVVTGALSPFLNADFRVVSLQSFSSMPFLDALPYATFCIGLGEEGLFRGYMQTKFSEVIGPWKAIFAQAMLFGLAHVVPGDPVDFQVTRFLFTFVFGAVMGVYFRYARSLAAVSLVHGLQDSVPEGFIPLSSSFIPVSLIGFLASGNIVGFFQVLITLAVTTKLMEVFVLSGVIILLLLVFARRICGAFAVVPKPVAS